MKSRPPTKTRPLRRTEPATSAIDVVTPAPVDDETPTQRLDRLAQTRAASTIGNLSPIALGLAWADWA